LSGCGRVRQVPSSDFKGGEGKESLDKGGYGLNLLQKERL